MWEPSRAFERPTIVRSTALLVLVSLMAFGCGSADSDSTLAPQSAELEPTTTEGPGSSTALPQVSPSDSTTSPGPTQPSTTVPVVTAAPSPDRPPAATPTELERRAERMPWPTDYGLSPALAELLAAFERGDDWTGTLVGIAFFDVAADEWRMCWAIDESLPVGCGSGVVLSATPPAYLASPERFETQTYDSSDEPAVIISTSSVSVHGTFFADSALFVPSNQ